MPLLSQARIDVLFSHTLTPFPPTTHIYAGALSEGVKACIPFSFYSLA